jgi:adenylate kinase
MANTAAAKYRSILLFGMPGSGKGTQGAVLGQLPGYVHISSGELLRKLPKWGELGSAVLRHTSQGTLVPDDLTVKIFLRHIKVLEIQELLLPREHILILDGLPRNYEQARMLAEVLDVVQIFHLKINTMENAIDRLHARALRENRLDDTSTEVIMKRIKVYHEETYQTLKFYDPKLVYDVDGAQTPLGVLCDISNRLRALEADWAAKE